MTSVYVVSRVKAGGGYTTDIPDRVYFHEHRAKAYCELMNRNNASKMKDGKAFHELRFAYRKMPVYGRKVVFEDASEPEPGSPPMETPASPVIIPPVVDKLAEPRRGRTRKNPAPVEQIKEEKPRRRRAMRTNKNETKTEGVAQTA